MDGMAAGARMTRRRWSAGMATLAIGAAMQAGAADPQGSPGPYLRWAQAWYASPGYREIMPMRHRSATSRVFIMEGFTAPAP